MRRSDTAGFSYYLEQTEYRGIFSGRAARDWLVVPQGTSGWTVGILPVADLPELGIGDPVCRDGLLDLHDAPRQQLCRAGAAGRD